MGWRKAWTLSFVFLIWTLDLSVAYGGSREPSLLDGALQSVVDSFAGPNLLLHAAAFGSTALFVRTGVDAEVHDFFSQSGNTILLPGYILGSGLVASMAFVPLFVMGKEKRAPEMIGAAFAIAQSAVLTVSYVSVLKFITGRLPPDHESDLSSYELSKGFRFGLGRGGIWDGWPSGHASHVVSVMSALAHYYSDQEWLTWMGLGLSLYMILTVSSYNGGQMHWFSEAIAGTFVGYAIGSSVGKNMRKAVDGKEAGYASVNLAPLAVPSGGGVAVTIRL